MLATGSGISHQSRRAVPALASLEEWKKGLGQAFYFASSDLAPLLAFPEFRALLLQQHIGSAFVADDYIRLLVAVDVADEELGADA
jgi:hypothetical protein